MAFTDETIRPAVDGSFTGTGNTDSTLAYSADVFITGTFVATVVVEAEGTDQVWRPACSFTEAAARTVRFANTRPIRVTVAAYTSGTVGVRMESINAYERQR